MIIGLYVAVTYTACGAFPRKENGFLQLSIFLSAQKINDPKVDTKDTSLLRFRENLPTSYYTGFINGELIYAWKVVLSGETWTFFQV